jgi:hypothetical protein
MARSRVSRLDGARHPGSLRDVTKLRWVIAICFAGGLALGFFVVYGLTSKWGANQWGPVAAWLSGAALFAVVWQARIAQRQAGIAQDQAEIAQRDSARMQLSRLIDHEVSRRRECIKAVADLWAAITSVVIDFSAFTDYLENLPQTWTGRKPLGEALTGEVGRRFESFFNRWTSIIQPPLFVALATLHSTNMYADIVGIRDAVAAMSAEDTEGGFIAVRKEMFRHAEQDIGHCPNTRLLKEMWKDIIRQQNEHLGLVQAHFSLARNDVEAYVLEHHTPNRPGAFQVSSSGS